MQPHGWNTYPTTVGTYQLKFDFLGTFFPTAMLPGGFFRSGPQLVPSVYYKPSSSPLLNLTVQADMVASWSSPYQPTTGHDQVMLKTENGGTIFGNFPPTGYVGRRLKLGYHYTQIQANIQCTRKIHSLGSRTKHCTHRMEETRNNRWSSSADKQDNTVSQVP